MLRSLLMISENSATKDLLTIPEASRWATAFLQKPVSNSNISYLIQYALIKKRDANGAPSVSLAELKDYYEQNQKYTENKWKDERLNWALSFSNCTEAETTKHVHRLHPYKGKFIPQLVEYFLDMHTDVFKKESYFKAGDIVLDPFCGSGTTLVQANELGLHAVGIDVSLFNTLIANCKLADMDMLALEQKIDYITHKLQEYYNQTMLAAFDTALQDALNAFNTHYFSAYDYKYAIRTKTIDEKTYSKQKVDEFLPTYTALIEKYGISLETDDKSFITKWFLPSIRSELYLMRDLINAVADAKICNVLRVILSRTMRSCRATTHSDLATLLEPVKTTYYCTKHYKICKPLFSITKWWSTYSKDTVKRLYQFSQLRTNTAQICLTGDSRTIDLLSALREKNELLYNVMSAQKIRGIFSSPPYVGLIDYHEQHAYTYELFSFPRHDIQEIGPLRNGQTLDARAAYVEGIAAVLSHCKHYLADDYNVFLVANDKYNLYPHIAEKARMRIVNRYERPVLNRTEKAKNAYSETIFHFKEL